MSLGEMDFLWCPISSVHRCSASICRIEEHLLLYLFLYLILELMVEQIFFFFQRSAHHGTVPLGMQVAPRCIGQP